MPDPTAPDPAVPPPSDRSVPPAAAPGKAPRMQSLTFWKAVIAFSLAFLGPIAAGLHTVDSFTTGLALFLGGVISGLTALRSFFDQSYARDPVAKEGK